MTVMALAGAAAAGVPGMGGAHAITPAFGLGFRFTVKVDRIGDLGGWQTCTGLKVEFKSTEIRQGGDYLSSTYLPDKLVYPKVVLKRAVDAESTRKVQTWVNNAAHRWLSGGRDTASTVTITLYDSSEKKVLSWELHNARPAAWSGPDLDATSSKVAIETLELVHEGFELKPEGTSLSNRAEQPSAKVPEISDGTGSPLKFRFAPEVVKLEMRGKDMRGRGGQVAQAEEAYLPGVACYQLSKLILDGPDTKADVMRLITWATPVPRGEPPKAGGHRPTWTPASPSGSKKGASRQPPGGSKSQPQVEFTWGDAINAKVLLKSLTAEYTRFSASGAPLRAVIGLTLQVVEELAAKPSGNGAGNPTSGGIAGRASHEFVEGDTLPFVARSQYGDAGAWRDVAAANHIDDPLRVRPGRLLYLPAAIELTEAGRP